MTSSASSSIELRLPLVGFFNHRLFVPPFFLPTDGDALAGRTAAEPVGLELLAIDCLEEFLEIDLFF